MEMVGTDSVLPGGAAFDQDALERELELERWGTRFRVSRTEADYRRWQREAAVSFIRLGLYGSIGAWLGAAVGVGLAIPADAWSFGVPVAVVMLPVIAWSLVTTYHRALRFALFPSAMAANALAGLLAVFLCFRVIERPEIAMAGIVIVVFYVFTIMRFRLAQAAWVPIPYLAYYAWELLASPTGADLGRATVILYLTLPILAYQTGFITGAVLDRLSRQQYRQGRLIEAQAAAIAGERERSDALLHQILPRRIAEQLKASPRTIAEQFDGVTILFADIVDFTPLSETMSPIELVTVLSRTFEHFDELADAHGVEKIKTIGDAYMAVAGVPTARDDHASAAADLALALRDATARLSNEIGVHIELRLGLHSGHVVAGVIGRRKFSYDLWGDAVNVAARMESHGVPGEIQVSQQTYSLLRDRYQLRNRGDVNVKGKGRMQTWFLDGIVTRRQVAGTR